MFLFRKERITSSKRSLPDSFSNDSVCSSVKSAPCDLSQPSASTARQQLSFEDLDDLESSLYDRGRRPASLGSRSSLDGQ